MIVPDNQPDLIYQAFLNKGPAVQAALLTSAEGLFAGLALIELVWVIGWSVANKSDIQDMVVGVTRWAIAIGFWFFMLQNWVQMGQAITDTFGIWGNSAVTAAGGTANMMPMGFIAAGLNLWHALWQAVSIGHPIVSAALVVAGIIDTVVFAWIAAQIMLVLIEAFLASYLGSVLIAFGGNSYTRDFAMSPIRYAIAVGMKRMTLQFIAGIAEGIVTNFATQVQAVGGGQVGWDDVGVMLAVPIILATLAWIAPKIAQDIIIGSHLTTGAGIIATATAIAGIAAGAAAGAVGAAAASVAGYQLAGQQMLASTTASSNTLLGMARTDVAKLGQAAANVAKSAASDVGQRMTGNYSATHGRVGWRIANRMSNQTNDMKTRGTEGNP